MFHTVTILFTHGRQHFLDHGIRQILQNVGDVIVVEPNSEFFKYLKSQGKGGEKGK